MSNALQEYLSLNPENVEKTGFIAFLSQLIEINKTAPGVVRSIIKELGDQRTNLKLIASENFSSLATQFAMGNLLTDKYAEGFPGHRFYAGCDNVDDIESLACAEACKLFGADHAYVQPHSGADANLVAFWSILTHKIQTPLLEELKYKKLTDMTKEDWNRLREAMGSQKLLGMDYYAGGHLTHGYRYNISAQIFDAYTYGVSRESGLIDYDALAETVKELKPLVLLAGFSAYPRKIDFSRMREIADSVGAVLMVDMAHFAGLVGGKVFTGKYNPVEYADIVTSTTHKTLRGPRGGLILCRKELAETVDKGCPMILGGPLPHVLAAKAVAFIEANTPEFQTYAARIVENSDHLAKALVKEGITLQTSGTENHLMLIDVRSFGLTGRQAESALRECGITLNRNSLPEDPNGPWYTSGLRIGTPAITSLGMGTTEMEEIAGIIARVLKSTKAELTSDGKPGKAKYSADQEVITGARKQIQELLTRFLLYPEIDLEFLRKCFS